jgi:hypothetical protein
MIQGVSGFELRGTGTMRNLLAGFAATLILTGCGLPPALTVASTLADGISYIASGKSVSDHALSAVTEQDCAVLRLLNEREICIEYADTEAATVLASVPGLDTWAPVDSRTDVPRAEVTVAVLATESESVLAEPAVPEPVSTARFAAAEPATKPNVAMLVAARSQSVIVARFDVPRERVTVLGSYRNPANAERALVRYAALAPRIIESPSRHGTLLRIVSDVTVGEARSKGVADAWPLRRTLEVAALR